MTTVIVEIRIPHEPDFDKLKFDEFMDDWMVEWRMDYFKSITHPNWFQYSTSFETDEDWTEFKHGFSEELREFFIDFSNKKQITVLITPKV